MPYLFVGAGQAGSAIVDKIFGHKNMRRIATPLVFNSTVRDLQNLSNVNESDWYGIAEGRGLVPGGASGFEEKVEGGFGRDPVEADRVMEEIVQRRGLENALSDHFADLSADEDDPAPADIKYTFLFVGLGGGTGCGIAPYLVESIRNHTDDRTRVIAICVLPNTEGPVGNDETEASPSRQAWNTRYGLTRLENNVDGIVFVDNQRLSYHVAAEGRFSEFNEYVASTFVDLVSGPVLEKIDPSDYEDIDVPVVDLADIVTSLSFGVGAGSRSAGYAALGRSVTMTRSLAGYLLPVGGRKRVDSAALTQLADAKLSLVDIDTDDAQQGIGLVRAPDKRIGDSKRGIETSVFRRHLQSKCGEVNLGVTQTNRNLASFSMLLTFERDDIERLDEIESLAKEYEHKRGGIKT